MLQEKRACECHVVEELINDPVEHGKYFDNVKKLDTWEQQGILELYAGDSFLDEIPIHCEREDRYIISHYYRCKKCDKVYFIGFCCRGGYLFKIKDCDLKEIDFRNIMSGKEQLGSYFNNPIRYRNNQENLTNQGKGER